MPPCSAHAAAARVRARAVEEPVEEVVGGVGARRAPDHAEYHVEHCVGRRVVYARLGEEEVEEYLDPLPRRRPDQPDDGPRQHRPPRRPEEFVVASRPVHDLRHYRHEHERRHHVRYLIVKRYRLEHVPQKSGPVEERTEHEQTHDVSSRQELSFRQATSSPPTHATNVPPDPERPEPDHNAPEGARRGRAPGGRRSDRPQDPPLAEVTHESARFWGRSFGPRPFLLLVSPGRLARWRVRRGYLGTCRSVPLPRLVVVAAAGFVVLARADEDGRGGGRGGLAVCEALGAGGVATAYRADRTQLHHLVGDRKEGRHRAEGPSP